MSVKGFTFYLTYMDVASELETPEEQGEFYRAIAEYMFKDNDIEQELSKNARIAFKCIKANLKRSKQRSKSGKNGMVNRYQKDNKAVTNQQQKDNKAVTNQQQKDNKAVTNQQQGQGQGQGQVQVQYKNTLSGKPDGAYAEIVGYLNERCGTAYKPGTPKTQSLIRARLNEGFTVGDFKAVIDKMASKWGSRGDMVRYLRPETLFGTKFESYLNERDELDALDPALMASLSEWEANAICFNG